MGRRYSPPTRFIDLANYIQRSAEEEKETSKKVKVDTASDVKSKSKKKSNVEVEIRTSKAPKAEDKEEKEEKEEKLKPKPKSSSTSKLKEGDKLPSIKLENEDGEEVDISTLTGGGKGVVIFVYPKVGSILLVP